MWSIIPWRNNKVKPTCPYTYVRYSRGLNNMRTNIFYNTNLSQFLDEGVSVVKKVNNFSPIPWQKQCFFYEGVCFVLNQVLAHCHNNFHVTPFGPHYILTPRQPIFVLAHYCCGLGGIRIQDLPHSMPTLQ